MTLTLETRTYHDSWRFIVEIEGIRRAQFMAISGLRGEFEIIEHNEGGITIPYKDPGRVTFDDLTLTRGVLTGDNDMYDWWESIADPAVSSPLGDGIGTGVGTGLFKRTLDVVQLGQDNTSRVRTWRVFEAFPRAFEPGAWDNGNNEKTVETVTLAYRYFKLIRTQSK